MFKLSEIPYQLTYQVGGVRRATVYMTKEELRNAVVVLYEVMEKDDILEIHVNVYVQMFDGSEAYHVIEVFRGTETKVSELLTKL